MYSLHLRLLTLVLCSFCVLVHPGKVYLNNFTTSYGLTGCISNPTKECGGKGDICYSDRENEYAFSGTSPLCSACMPKNFRNIATYAYPANLPCAIWRAYGCDDHFVTYLWNKSGSNSCWMGGSKSYNIKNTFSSAAEAEKRFITQCRREKTLADYDLPAGTERITESEFCFPLRNNITDIVITGEGGELTVLTDYTTYYENKFNLTVRALV